MTAPRLDTDPWLVREPHVDPGTLSVAESLFALSNGYVGMRGTLDEVEPSGMRGTYLSGVYEIHPLSYPEGGYGQPEEGQAMLTVADGTPMRLLVDGIVLDVREVRPQLHERTLDLRAGTLDRRVRWTAQSGATVEVRSRRLVSLVERSVSAIRYEVRVHDAPAHVVIRSELAAGEVTPTGVDNDDPRVAAALDEAFDPRARIRTDSGGALVERTRTSGITMAAAVAHEVDGGRMSTHVDGQHVVTTIAANLRPGEEVTVVKVVGHSWSHDARDSSLSAAVQAVVCAQAQHPDLALRHLRECALVDLRDIQGDTAGGLHLAAVAGTWLGLVAGLGGLREDHEELEIAPLLPSPLSRTAYHVTWRGRSLRVETTRAGTTVTLVRGEGPLTVVVDGTPMSVTAAAPVLAPLRAPDPLLDEPRQPPGRDRARESSATEPAPSAARPEPLASTSGVPPPPDLARACRCGAGPVGQHGSCPRRPTGARHGTRFALLRTGRAA